MFNNFFFSENRAVYNIFRKNCVERDWPQMTMLRMRIACWIPRATNTQSEYAVSITFPLQQWLHECASTLRNMYIACLVSMPNNNIQNYSLNSAHIFQTN
jgi:hypothetical protein